MSIYVFDQVDVRIGNVPQVIVGIGADQTPNVPVPCGPPGRTGPKGDPGAGFPAGGSEGQALVKASDEDYDADWATLTAEDVGALPDDTFIPTKTSDLTNDTGFLSAEEDPNVPSWAKQPSKPGYTAAEVGLGNVANERQYSAGNPPPYPVTSVNGRTGAVIVKAIHFTVSITELPFTVTDSRITADMRVIEAVLGTPGAVTTDLGWTTAAGSIVFSGTLASGGSTTLDFDLIEAET